MPKSSKKKSIEDYTRIIRFWRLGMSRSDIASEVACSSTKVDAVIFCLKKAERNEYEALYKKASAGKNGSPLIVETVLRSLNKWDDYAEWATSRRTESDTTCSSESSATAEDPFEAISSAITEVNRAIGDALRKLADALELVTSHAVNK